MYMLVVLVPKLCITVDLKTNLNLKWTIGIDIKSKETSSYNL